MNLNELKSQWNAVEATKKSPNELSVIIAIKEHPELKKIKIRLVIELILLTVYLSIYHNIFDGHDKPDWTNIALISSAVFFIATDFYGWLLLRNPIKKDSITQSLSSFYRSLKVIGFTSPIASLFFGSSIILFFAIPVELTPIKFLILSGMILTLITSIYISGRNWLKKSNRIKEVITEFESYNSNDLIKNHD